LEPFRDEKFRRPCRRSLAGRIGIKAEDDFRRKPFQQARLRVGQRRAAQVKRYLTSKGIEDARISTQSMGDSQPAVQGTDESAYQQNRRAEFQAAGASTLVAPRS